ncbi:hypothetical protein PC110_g6817 [Phytophthora cactorum]|uniref:Homeodomain-like n=1 Tax=Phytophthora cactorum TaxID=29920 RepID=A0A329SJ94_9STRA|nr:hypothetical protein PC110_g6817 [Phytophthora cactorum]
MPTRYARYALETKLRVVEVARRGGVWEETAEHLGVNYHTVRAWVRQHMMHAEDVRVRPRADALEHERGVVVVPQTVKNHVDGACFTLKRMHTEPQYMNPMRNKQKWREYLAQLQQYQAMGKTTLYMDETNFNL